MRKKNEQVIHHIPNVDRNSFILSTPNPPRRVESGKKPLIYAL